MLSHGFCLRRGGFLTKSAVCGRADVLHLVMLGEVETSFSSRARWTRHAVSLRWVLNQTPSAALVPLPKEGQFFLSAVCGRAAPAPTVVDLGVIKLSLFGKRDEQQRCGGSSRLLRQYIFLSAVTGRADVLHLVMLSEVETSFSSRARWTRHAVSLRWVLNQTPSASLVPLH